MRRRVIGLVIPAALFIAGFGALAEEEWIVPLPTVQDVLIEDAIETQTPGEAPTANDILEIGETPEVSVVPVSSENPEAGIGLAPDETPNPPTSPMPIPTPEPDAPLSQYYETVLRPQMDLIGDNMRSLFNSQAELEAAFGRAKQGIDALETACQNVDALSTDEELMGYLIQMKSDIEEGLKRSDGVPGSDETIMGYQQNIAGTLKAFMDHIDAMFYE